MKHATIYAALLALFIAARAVGDDYHLIPARKYGKWGFINKEGEWVIPARYQEAYHFSEGKAGVQQLGKWGFIDNRGEWVIPPRFAQAKPFSEGMACAMVDQRWGYIDATGTWVIEPRLMAISSFSDGLALVGVEAGYTFIDHSGNQVISTIFRKALPFAEGLAFVVQDDYRGYIDRRGHWMIRHDYEEAYSFSEGLALVKENGLYGFIDLRGELAINCVYDDALFFREGVAAVKMGLLWGFVNRRGNMVIDPIFESAHAFSEGYAVVKTDGRYGLIDHGGGWVLGPEYSGLSRHTLSISLERQITDAVKRMFGTWQLKGEFEKTEDYMARISEDVLQRHIDSLTAEALHDIASIRVRFAEAQLGLYDADAERFHVIIPGASSIMLPVPIAQARSVRSDWPQIWLGEATYGIQGDNFVLRTLSARHGEATYYYDASEDYQRPAGVLPPIGTDDIDIRVPVVPMITGIPLRKTLSARTGSSDVDVSIPINAIKNDRTFALIIGNEDYRSFQSGLQSESNVEFAEIDARIFRDYMVRTMGLPEDNVTLLINATAGQMRRALSKMRALAKAYEGDARLVFYYAGHGLPHPDTKDPHLIPVDVHASDLNFAVKLDDVYAALIEHPSERVTVFLDACFSGGGRSEGLAASRGVRIKPKSPFVQGNLIVFSASHGMQHAYPYREKTHGMFTYYLLRGLQISEGKITYGELSDLISGAVKRRSIIINEREQEPEVRVSPLLEDSWKEFIFLPGDAVQVQGRQ